MSRIEDLWDDNHLPPFYGTPKQLMELGEVVGKCIDNCNASSNIREIVIETWITIDFAIRQLLLSGFNLTGFSDQELDISYLLLPNSFKELVNILKKTRKYCIEHKSSVKVEKKDTSGGFTSSYAFWKFIKENNPELLKKIIEITDEYRRQMTPGLLYMKETYYIEESQSLFESKNKLFEELSDDWKEVICNLDGKWFKRIDKLNDARNFAAHNHNAQQIARYFGKTEPNLVKKVRSECFSLMRQLLNIKCSSYTAKS